MKKTFVLFGLLMLAIGATQAQPNFGKLKDKVKDKAGDAVKKDDQKTNGTTTPSVGGKGNVESSPAAASIRNYRNALSFAQDAVKGKHDDAGSRLEKLKPMLDKIKQEDPNWAEYSKDEAAYLDLKKQYESNQAGADRQQRLERLDNACFLIGKEPWRYNDYAEKLQKKIYDDLKQEYAGQTLSQYETKAFNNAENFFTTKLPEVKTQALKQIKEKSEGKELFLKASRTQADYMKRFNLESDPKWTINDLADALKRCENALLILSGDAELEKLKTELITNKTDVEQYVSGGEYAKHVELKKQMIIEERRVGKAMTVDASLDAVVRRDFNSKDYGAIQRISITDKDWYISKNDFDLPLKKSKDVEIAVKFEGKCYLMLGSIECTYEGGGRYGAPAYYNHGGSMLEMNCANVNK